MLSAADPEARLASGYPLQLYVKVSLIGVGSWGG